MGSMKPTEWGMLILLSIFGGGSFFFVEIALRDFQPFTLVFQHRDGLFTIFSNFGGSRRHQCVVGHISYSN